METAALNRVEQPTPDGINGSLVEHGFAGRGENFHLCHASASINARTKLNGALPATSPRQGGIVGRLAFTQYFIGIDGHDGMGGVCRGAIG